MKRKRKGAIGFINGFVGGVFGSALFISGFILSVVYLLSTPKDDWPKLVKNVIQFEFPRNFPEPVSRKEAIRNANRHEQEINRRK